MLLYKYRSVNCGNFERFADIIQQNRLYAAKYSELNDPLEGHYFYNKDKIPREVISQIKHEKGKTRICSLSNTSDNYLVWSHYADGYRGIAIGVVVTDVNKPVPVTYRKQLQSFRKNLKAKDILMCKLNLWSYEDEYRVLTDQQYVEVQIKEIILGAKMDKNTKAMIKGFVKQTLPKVEIKESVPPSQSAFGLRN